MHVGTHLPRLGPYFCGVGGGRGNNVGCVHVHNGRHNMSLLCAGFKSNTENHIKRPNNDIFVWFVHYVTQLYKLTSQYLQLFTFTMHICNFTLVPFFFINILAFSHSQEFRGFCFTLQRASFLPPSPTPSAPSLIF